MLLYITVLYTRTSSPATYPHSVLLPLLSHIHPILLTILSHIAYIKFVPYHERTIIL